MKSAAKTLNPTRIRLTVDVPFDEFKPSLDAAYKAISYRLSIPGFRKGHVPPLIIDHYVGHGAVIEEAVNNALPRFYAQAVEEADVQPLGQPEVDVTKFPDPATGGELKFTAELDVRPKIELPDLEGIPVTVDDIKVEDDEVDRRLDALRLLFGTLVDVGRPAQPGDFVSIDTIMRMDGEEIGRDNGVSYNAGSGQILRGLRAGETKTFPVPLAKGDHAGKEAEVTVIVQSVKVCVLPRADDFETLEKLREYLRNQIATVMRAAQGMQARERLLEHLTETVHIPVPDGIVDEEVQRYLASEDRLGDEEHRAEVEAQVRKAFRTQLLLDAVAAKVGVSVNQQELDEYIVAEAQQYGMDPNMFGKSMDEAGQIPAMVSEVARRKALATLLEKAKVTDASGHVLEGQRAVLGPDSREMLESTSYLAALYVEQGRYGEAEPLLVKVVAGRRAVLGPNHPDTLASQRSLALLPGGVASPARFLVIRNRVDLGRLHEGICEGLREIFGAEDSSAAELVINSALNRGHLQQVLWEEISRRIRAGRLSRLREMLGAEDRGAVAEPPGGEAYGRYELPDAQDAQGLSVQLPDTVAPIQTHDTDASARLAALDEGYDEAMGRGAFAEAAALVGEAVALSREALGAWHMDTLGRIHTLACLFGDQGLYDEGVALLREELEGSRVAFGPEHPVTLGLMNQLAAFHLFHGPHGEAEAEAEALDREVLDAKGHGDPEMPLIDPGLVCLEQGLYHEAEMMLEHTLEERRARLGPSHPQTLASAGNLARVYLAQGRHDKAEPLLVEALEEAQVTLGPVHPTTLGIKLSRACNLAALGRIADALRQLQEMQPHILDRLDAELYTNETPGARRHAVASQAGYQDVALSLALLPGAGPAEAELAATAVLRLKGLQIEEEAFLARLARRDPSARERAAEIADLRGHLAALFNVAHKVPRHEGATDERWAEIAALGARLQEREFAFGRVSRDYAQHLQVRHFDLAGLGAFLARPPRRAALLELREYRPYDFRTSMSAPPRWAGLLMTPDRVRVVDLGPVAGTAETAEDLLANPETETERREVEERAQRAARKLYEQLISPLAAELAELKRLYLAPDGALNLVPFAALLGPDGRRLLEVLDVRLLQTGRDLLRPRPQRSAEGLLALGGIDFDADLPASSTTAPGATGPVLRGAIAELQRSTEETLPDGFEELPATAEEVRAVAALYRAARPGEPVEVWTGADASEARLKALPRPPRVLHLATHGFYLPRKTPLDRPMLLSGVTLAGANRALREPGQDGILYAIEVQDLDLEGTELVVLSACKTGLGQIDYGEGVSGLVRALRIAGARHVLVTLHEVIDEGAADFMQRFYRCWLGQERFYHRWLGRKHSDPVAAFRAAQLETIAAPPDSPARRDRTWAQFVMIGA